MKRLVLALALLSLTPVPEASAVPYSAWGAWDPYVYYSVTTKECAKGKQSSAGKANAWPQCRVAQRARKRIANIAGSWDLGQIQMEAHGPFNLFGVKNTSNYRYNGSFGVHRRPDQLQLMGRWLQRRPQVVRHRQRGWQEHQLPAGRLRLEGELPVQRLPGLGPALVAGEGVRQRITLVLPRRPSLMTRISFRGPLVTVHLHRDPRQRGPHRAVAAGHDHHAVIPFIAFLSVCAIGGAIIGYLVMSWYLHR